MEFNEWEVPLGAVANPIAGSFDGVPANYTGNRRLYFRPIPVREPEENHPGG
jgi:hypothetical protein